MSEIGCTMNYTRLLCYCSYINTFFSCLQSNHPVVFGDLNYNLSHFLQLKKEVVQLAQELEQARFEIEDLRRMVEEEKQREKETLSTERVRS